MPASPSIVKPPACTDPGAASDSASRAAGVTTEALRVPVLTLEVPVPVPVPVTAVAAASAVAPGVAVSGAAAAGSAVAAAAGAAAVAVVDSFTPLIKWSVTRSCCRGRW
ncbi:hypothetical protein PSCLAVI8L_240009 [Pseudoclavibacter sp. 8L]|nr:hypothetical protein PSCLAVI8L_240009 [Pseudoclavibacter sp. 8L]